MYTLPEESRVIPRGLVPVVPKTDVTPADVVLVTLLGILFAV